MFPVSLSSLLICNTLDLSPNPSSRPTSQPTSPSGRPTSQPTSLPSSIPTGQPSPLPTGLPTGQPSSMPTEQPVSRPTSKPSRSPTPAPTGRPSSLPTSQPTSQPSMQPKIFGVNTRSAAFLSVATAALIMVIYFFVRYHRGKRIKRSRSDKDDVHDGQLSLMIRGTGSHSAIALYSNFVVLH